MGYKIISAAAAVLTTAELRTQLRLTAAGEPPAHPHDALIDGLLKAAMESAQSFTNRAVGEQTIELAIDAFPSGAIELPLGAASITGVKYVGADEAEHTIDAGLYTLDNHSFKNWCLPVGDWPAASLVATGANVVKVVYKTPAAVPDAVKTALLLHVQHLYDNPSEPEPPAIQALLKTHKDWAV